MCRLIYLLVLTAIGSLGLSTLAHSEERPNILFAFADDWGRHASAYVATDGRSGSSLEVTVHDSLFAACWFSDRHDQQTDVKRENENDPLHAIHGNRDRFVRGNITGCNA